MTIAGYNSIIESIVKRPFSASGVTTHKRWIEQAFGGSVAGDEISDTLILLPEQTEIEIAGTKGLGQKDSQLSTEESIMDFVGVMTTPNRDRDGDVLLTEGAIVDTKMPLLYQHDWTVPVGKLVSVMQHDNQKLVGKFCVVGTDVGKFVAKLICAGVLRLSIGFRPIEYDRMRDETSGADMGGWKFTKFAIHECSVVSIPSNTDAEIMEFSKSMGVKLPASIERYYAKQKTDRSKFLVKSAGDKPGQASTATAIQKEQPTSQPIDAVQIIRAVGEVLNQQGDQIMAGLTASAGKKNPVKPSASKPLPSKSAIKPVKADDQKPEDEPKAEGEGEGAEGESEGGDQPVDSGSTSQKVLDSLRGWSAKVEKLTEKIDGIPQEVIARLSVVSGILNDETEAYIENTQSIYDGTTDDDLVMVLDGCISTVTQLLSGLTRAEEELYSVLELDIEMPDSIASGAAAIAAEIGDMSSGMREIVTESIAALTASVAMESEGDDDDDDDAAEVPVVNPENAGYGSEDDKNEDGDEDDPDANAARFLGSMRQNGKSLSAEMRRQLLEVLTGDE